MSRNGKTHLSHEKELADSDHVWWGGSRFGADCLKRCCMMGGKDIFEYAEAITSS